MTITFHGAAETTTGSQHLIEINGKRILLDCGLYQGHREEAYDRNKHFPFEPSQIDTVILSHAHIDHSGNLPNLSRQGFRGNIFATPATRDLCQIMLADSARIQMSDVEYVNRKRSRKGQKLFTPLYDERDAERCLRQFITLDYHRSLQVSDGVTLTFIDAGHIIGAAQVILDLEDHATGIKKRLLFSGDVGRHNNELLRDPEIAENVDAVIMESTYGGREHEQDTGARDKICEILNEALKKQGRVIIPAFAVERTQQLLVVLHDLFTKDCIPDVPVYVDSPLAVSATEIFRLHPECFNEEVYEALFSKNNPFGFDGLHMVRQAKDSMKLNGLEGPFIIIAASGMCEAGRVLHHLHNNIEDTSTTVLFVGYCAENTLGWKLRNGDKEVNIFGEPHHVRARIEILDGFSGHADHSELIDWFERTTGSKKQVWLVHGEVQRSSALRAAMKEKYPERTIEIARLGQTVTIEA
ncbi:MAG TPA: MBL fold metallo-hydrolase [Verrucomicrobiales bacterium]|nr:MBL fold metallo-hydrolase [Verrucomicrobiales bacterium]